MHGAQGEARGHGASTQLRTSSLAVGTMNGGIVGQGVRNVLPVSALRDATVAFNDVLRVARCDVIEDHAGWCASSHEL